MTFTLAMRFVDTNILLYAISSAEEELAKATAALEILTAHDLVLSVQVLQEFYVQSTHRRHPRPLSHQEACSLIQSFQRYPVVELNLPLMNAALRCHERFQISYWDAAIIEAARASGCELVLSEDLNDGQDFAGIRVHNPFLS